jgi:hypothetical protein
MATKPAKTEPKTNLNTEANRKRRLERTIKAQPNNEQAKLALKDSKSKRKAPNKREWSHTARRLAQLFKLFTGRAPKELFSANRTVQDEALRTISGQRAVTNTGKVDFTIRARAHDKAGRLVWI